MDYFYFDCETRSSIDLKTVGRANYFRHPKTEVTLISWAINNGPVEQWAIGDKIPESLLSILKRKDNLIKVAHNIGFDMAAIAKLNEMHPIGTPKEFFDPSTFVDTMALGNYYRVGSSLDRICKVLGVDTKAIHGKALMNKQSKPDRKGNFPVQLNDEEMEHFKQYGKHDVEMCRMIHQKFDPLPTHERQIWEWTFKNNQEGIPIDIKLLSIMQFVLNRDAHFLLPEFAKITGTYKIGSIKLREFFKEYYSYCDNLRATTIKKMLEDPDPTVPDKIRRALKIKSMLGSTSVKKVFKALDLANGDVIRDTLSYHQAITKRWSGRDENAPGIQVQNFPRSSYTEQDLDPRDPEFFKKVHTLYSVEALNSQWVKNNLRRIFIAREGKHIHCADYSRIEPVVIFWLAGIGSIPDKWYEAMASKVFGVGIEEIKKDSYERHIGKFASLSCGYGIGPKGFAFKANEAGVTVDDMLAYKCVTQYHHTHPEVVRQWYKFENAFKHCFQTGEEITECNALVKFNRLRGLTPGTIDMEITLPSGGKIFYRKVEFGHINTVDTKKHGVSLVPTKKVDKTQITYLTANKGRVKLWHGALMEHICSGTARELMASALLRLERNGYRVINTIHDELWVEADPGDEVQQHIKKIMEIVPEWATGLKELKVEIESGERYLK